MKPQDAKAEVERLVGRSLSTLKCGDALNVMLEFYRDQRVAGASLPEDQDMLLCQWGVYDLDGGRVFRFDVIRQFIESGTEDEDGMTQLVLGCIYDLDAKLQSLKPGEITCHTPEECANFGEAARRSEVFDALSGVEPRRVTLDYYPI